MKRELNRSTQTSTHREISSPVAGGTSRRPKAAMSEVSADEQRIEALQHATFGYFERVANPSNGLVRDNTRSDSPASIVGSGLAMACYAVAAERGYVTREQAVERVLATLRFFWNVEQSERPEATGYRGFFYHLLDVLTGTRAHECELSTLDSAVVFIGGLVAAAYFDGDSANEREIRVLADALYRRADWAWMLDAYCARGVPYGPDDGTLSPWAVVASLPFAPEIVLPHSSTWTPHTLQLPGSTATSAASTRPSANLPQKRAHPDSMRGLRRTTNRARGGCRKATTH